MNRSRDPRALFSKEGDPVAYHTRDTSAPDLVKAADQKLFALNNMLSLLEYRRDLGDAAAAAQVDETREAIRTLLSDPALLSASRACLEMALAQDEPGTARKALLLENEIRFSEIENDPSVRHTRESVRLKMIGFGSSYSGVMRVLTSNPDRHARSTALTQHSVISKAMEPLCRESFVTLNQVARRAGYETYADAKLSYEALSTSDLLSEFREWREEHLPLWQRWLRAAKEQLGDGVRPHDLLYMSRQCTMMVDHAFASRHMTRVTEQLLCRLGVALSDLPVSIETRELSHAGACYRVIPGSDVRLVLNQNNTGLRACFFLLHELGHAMYYCYCPTGSELLIDRHPAREIMADLWTRFLNEKDFLLGPMGLDSDVSDQVIRELREYETVRLFLFLRDATFAFHVLRDPSTPFGDIWRATSNEWIGIDDDSGAFDLFDFVNPLDMKNYVLAQMWSKTAFGLLSARASGRSGLPSGVITPELLCEMIERFYRPGNSIDWRMRIGLTAGAQYPECMTRRS